MGGTLAEAHSHNVPQATFVKHYQIIRDLQDAQKDAAAAVARAKKAAKSDGVDLDVFKVTEKRAKLDPDEREMFDRKMAVYAHYLSMPIGTQFDMFGLPPVDAKATAEQAEWDAGSNGYKAGEKGIERKDNPHNAGSAEHVAWDKSWIRGNKVWMKGQAKLAGEMGANAGRGRRRGNGVANPPF